MCIYIYIYRSVLYYWYPKELVFRLRMTNYLDDKLGYPHHSSSLNQVSHVHPFGGPMVLCSLVLYLTLSAGGDALYGTILAYIAGQLF